MRTHRTSCALVAIALAAGALPALAAGGARAIDGAPYVIDADIEQRSRALTESACAQAGDVAAALTHNLQTLQGEMWRTFQQTRIEAQRELTPLLHRFADQLRDLARQLDSAPVPHDS